MTISEDVKRAGSPIKSINDTAKDSPQAISLAGIASKMLFDSMRSTLRMDGSFQNGAVIRNRKLAGKSSAKAVIRCRSQIRSNGCFAGSTSN
jgi:hypothetical protein